MNQKLRQILEACVISFGGLFAIEHGPTWAGLVARVVILVVFADMLITLAKRNQER